MFCYVVLVSVMCCLALWSFLILQFFELFALYRIGHKVLLSHPFIKPLHQLNGPLYLDS